MAVGGAAELESGAEGGLHGALGATQRRRPDHRRTVARRQQVVSRTLAGAGHIVQAARLRICRQDAVN